MVAPHLMNASLAILRGTPKDVAGLFVAGADARLQEPPLPFVPIVALDTPNADHLGGLFLDAAGVVVGRGESAGSAFFDACTTVFEGPDGNLVLVHIPVSFVDALARLTSDEVAWAAMFALPVPIEKEVPKNPFTGVPQFTEAAYRAHIRSVYDAVVQEIESVRRLLFSARAAREDVWLWCDQR
jgi:hypothetical protein